MKLHYSRGACSLAAHIVAREGGLDFDLTKVDLAAYETEAGDDYLAINPRGYVPAIKLDTEVAAVVQYLGEQAPQADLAPPPGSKERFQVNQWVAFVATEMHKTFSPWLFQAKGGDSTKQQASRDKLGRRFAELDRHLATRAYLTGDTFTVADAYAFTIVNWSNFVEVDLAPYLNLSAYMARVGAHPKVREALVAESLVAAATEGAAV